MRRRRTRRWGAPFPTLEVPTSPRLLLLLVVTACFAVLTAAALADVGYLGIFKPHFESLGGAQVFVDLVILAVMLCAWMAGDSHSSGIPAWPFVALTLAAGSFGPLLYLIVREARGARAAD